MRIRMVQPSSRHRRSGGLLAPLAFILLLAPACVDTDQPPADGQALDTATAGDTAAQRVEVAADVGLQTPESVLHDAEADVYLVSNINGAPLDKDDNGFISRVRPDGTVDSLRWIDGATANVTLHAPKGLALSGDTLFVSDIDSVRAFDRGSGAPLGARGVPGAAFLNDLATGDDGTLYVTDTGVDASFESTGREAIYRFEDGQATAVAQGAELAGPNGIVIADGDVLVVPFGAAAIFRIPAGGGAPDTLATLPGGQLDGIIRLDDGTLLVSSWESSAVFRVPPQGEAEAIIEDVPSPADIGWDGQRRRVLIPVFTENRLIFAPVR